MQRAVRHTTLLWILGAGPLVAVLALLDHFIFQSSLRQAMDLPIQQILTITALLTFPHIVASLIGFADPEYASYYRKPLLRGLALSFGIALACWLFLDGYVILFIVAFYSVYHNIQQQFGITAMMLRMKQSAAYVAMKWLFVIPSALAFAAITLVFVPAVEAWRPTIMLAIHATLALATALAIPIGLQLAKNRNSDKTALRYFLGNLLAIYVGYALFMTGYGLLAVFLQRFIHDATAYWIYMVHDENRNGTTNHNAFYSLPLLLGLKPFYALIPIAVVISALTMSLYEWTGLMAVVISACNILHYYIEGHTWKHGTPHRQHVPFV